MHKPIQNVMDVTKIKGNRLFYANISDNDKKIQNTVEECLY